MKRIFVGLLFALAGCSASSRPGALPDELKLLEGATSIELVALDPLKASMRQSPPADVMRGFGVLGRATLSDAARCDELVRLIARGIAESDGSAAMCFNPRHGLRVRRDGRTLELLICYECLQMRAWSDAGSTQADVLTSASVEPAVSSLFEAAGLVIAAR